MKQRTSRTLGHTATGFVWRALAIVGLFLIAHLLGWRNDACVLAGATPVGATATWAAVRGLLYVGLYFGCVVGVPILMIAAGLVAATHWATGGKASASKDSSPAAPAGD